MYGSSKHSLAMGTDVQRIVPDHLQKVLVQQDYITAFLACVCFNVSIPEGALQVKNLQIDKSTTLFQCSARFKTSTHFTAAFEKTAWQSNSPSLQKEDC